jgi:tetratricopeptide (TPR) repeat protein
MKKVKLIAIILLISHEVSNAQEATDSGFSDQIEAGQNQLKKGNYKKAVTIFNSLIKIAEKDSLLQEIVSEIYLYRAESNIRMKSTENVCKDLETAIRFNIHEAFILAKENCPSILTPKMESELISKTGSNYFWDKEYEKAIPYFTKALELYPNEFTLSQRALSFHFSKQPDKELMDYSILIQISKDNPSYYGGRGQALFELNRFEESLTDLNKAISLDSSNVIYYISRGMTNSALKDYHKAIYDLTRVINEFPGGEFYLDRAKSYLGIGDKSNACEDLKKIAANEITEEVRELLKNCAQH